MTGKFAHLSDVALHDSAHLAATFHAEISSRYVALQELLDNGSANLDEVMRERLGRLGYAG